MTRPLINTALTTIKTQWPSLIGSAVAKLNTEWEETEEEEGRVGGGVGEREEGRRKRGGREEEERKEEREKEWEEERKRGSKRVRKSGREGG